MNCKFYQDLISGKFATMVKENIKGQKVNNSEELYNIMKPLTAQEQAAAVIFCHNHPSGSSDPSPEDLSITFQLMIALQSVGVTIHEHLIVGDRAFYSMADRGTIARLKTKYKDLTRV